MQRLWPLGTHRERLPLTKLEGVTIDTLATICVRQSAYKPSVGRLGEDALFVMPVDAITVTSHPGAPNTVTSGASSANKNPLKVRAGHHAGCTSRERNDYVPVG